MMNQGARRRGTMTGGDDYDRTTRTRHQQWGWGG
jgi:hypothetical protein